MTNEQKPPLGITPEKFFNEDVNEKRIKTILEAMLRRVGTEAFSIPKEWRVELNRRLEVRENQ